MAALSLKLGTLAWAAPLSLSDSEAHQGSNLLTWGDAILLNSDTEGRVAIGGDAQFGSFSVGQAARIAPATAAMVVGGNLQAGHGQAHQGTLHVGGSYSGPGYVLNSAPVSQILPQHGSRNLWFDFEAARSALTGKSGSLASAQATGTSSLEHSTLTLQGMDAALNIFNVEARSLALASMLNLVTPGTAKALIIVSGTVARMSNMGFGGGLRAEHTLFNFYEATSLSLHSVGIAGSLLAPRADVDFSSGQMNGQLIADSFGGARWGSGELRDYRFDNDPPRASVPDVGSTFILGLLGIGLLFLLKRLR